jgi:hypothetical protein
MYESRLLQSGNRRYVGFAEQFRIAEISFAKTVLFEPGNGATRVRIKFVLLPGDYFGNYFGEMAWGR